MIGRAGQAACALQRKLFIGCCSRAGSDVIRSFLLFVGWGFLNGVCSSRTILRAVMSSSNPFPLVFLIVLIVLFVAIFYLC